MAGSTIVPISIQPDRGSFNVEAVRSRTPTPSPRLPDDLTRKQSLATMSSTDHSNNSSIEAFTPSFKPPITLPVKPFPVTEKPDADSGDENEEDGDEMTAPTKPTSTTDSGTASKSTGHRASVLDLQYYSQMFTNFREFVKLFFTFQIILDPFSHFKKAWDYMIITMVLYNAFVIPFYIAFDVHLSQVLLPFDIICTISMAMDILVTFRTGFLDFSGNMCYDSRIIARRYWNRGLILDLVGTFPMDIFSPMVVGYGQRYANVLKVSGLLRASRLAYNDRLGEFNSPTARMLKLLFLFFYVAHLFAASFFFVGCIEQSDMTWIIASNLQDATQTEQYIASLYWSLTTMVTVGYGDIVPVTVYEQAVVIPILMLSALIYATIFSNMAYAIETITSTVRRYQNRMDMVKEFINVYELPPDLQQKLFDYTNAMWNQNKGFETDEMLAHLPTSVKAEVMLHINESLIQRVPLLKQCSDRFLEAIILRMTSQVCLSGDYIFKQGDKSREMYFVRTGSVEIIMEDDENGVEEIIAEIHSFSDCPFFGEISLLLGETRTASAKATSKCVLASLSQQDFFEVLAMFPDEATSLRETASERIQADVDREKAAMAKKNKGSKSRIDSGNDEDGIESVKRMLNGASNGAEGIKKSKHENRLNALEMTTLSGASANANSGNALQPVSGQERRERGMSASSPPPPIIVTQQERRSSVSKVKPTIAGTRMERLNSQSQTNQPAPLRHMKSNASDLSARSLSGIDSEDEMSNIHRILLPNQANGDEMDEEVEPGSHMPHDMNGAVEDHRDLLKYQLSHDLPQAALAVNVSLAPALLSSAVAPLPVTHTAPLIHSPELANLRHNRDVRQARAHERNLEKAHLELESKVKSLEKQLSSVTAKLDAAVSVLQSLAEHTSFPAARLSELTVATSHLPAYISRVSLSHGRQSSISQRRLNVLEDRETT